MNRLLFRAGVLAAGVLMATASQAQPPAAAPNIGGWRQVSDSQFNRKFHFSMLPGVAAIGSNWAVYDSRAGKVVCCLVVEGPEVSEEQLGSVYDIPGPWITDLTNGWNLDAAPYRPRVQLLRVDGELRDYEFADAGDGVGGLLVPDHADVVAARSLEIDGERYAVERKDSTLADDDGGLYTYSLRPAKGGAPLKIEVPIGTY
ncbi:hypothetical protein DAI43_16470 [Achromobacter xylosoxidans]|uniref:hypothetical protein n=1 Tax=Achromobacter aegrifaciens TaxID=1287736 RepID=UPI000D4AA234|nr:hypothetical protein [Achromobacter aegrifaciens]MDQ1763551.1 hypothetical protein [Achromobacter aegrifaciens]PTN50501.1 hypothetical protein DAI43_16470 [Achromobacter xylosoxidans]